MANKTNEMTINGITYVPKDSLPAATKVDTDGLAFVICRGYYCGVHAGFLKKQDGNHVTLVKSRRLWSWKCKQGISLTSLATYGLEEDHAIPCALDEIWLGDVYEVIPCSVEAADSIINAPEREQE